MRTLSSKWNDGIFQYLLWPFIGFMYGKRLLSRREQRVMRKMEMLLVICDKEGEMGDNNTSLLLCTSPPAPASQSYLKTCVKIPTFPWKMIISFLLIHSYYTLLRMNINIYFDTFPHPLNVYELKFFYLCDTMVCRLGFPYFQNVKFWLTIKKCELSTFSEDFFMLKFKEQFVPFEKGCIIHALVS